MSSLWRNRDEGTSWILLRWKMFTYFQIVILHNSEYWRRLSLVVPGGICIIPHLLCGLPVLLFFPDSEPLGVALIIREKSKEMENDMKRYKEFQLVTQTTQWFSHWTMWLTREVIWFVWCFKGSPLSFFFFSSPRKLPFQNVHFQRQERYVSFFLRIILRDGKKSLKRTGRKNIGVAR